MNKENLHFFTFGNGHKLAGHVQPILAESPELARQVMVDKYGSEWAFQYTYEEYMDSKKRGYGNEIPLDPIKVEVVQKTKK